VSDTRPYYSEGGGSTVFYDLLTAADRSLDGDLDLYASLPPPGGSVLELGSGTGRISAALAQRGYDVTGLELSRPMLAQALTKRPPDLRLRYVEGDMRSFELDQRFDAIICPFYALAHLPPGPDWEATLRCVARHMKADGVAAFHLPVAEMMAAPSPPPGTPVFRSGPLTISFAGKTFDPAAGRMDLDLDYAAPTGRSRERLTLFAGDLEQAAAAATLVRHAASRPLGRPGIVHFYRLGQSM
jgi:SAM-dependent methyltransferase